MIALSVLPHLVMASNVVSCQDALESAAERESMIVGDHVITSVDMEEAAANKGQPGVNAKKIALKRFLLFCKGYSGFERLDVESKRQSSEEMVCDNKRLFVTYIKRSDIVIRQLPTTVLANPDQ